MSLVSANEKAVQTSLDGGIQALLGAMGPEPTPTLLADQPHVEVLPQSGARGIAGTMGL